MSLWDRVYLVDFPELGYQIRNLKITFEIVKDLSEETNKSKITIWNMSRDNITRVCNADIKVDLYAGYSENGGAVRIFSGTIIHGTSKDDGTDLVTELTLSDGQTTVRDSVFSLSYAAGTSGQTIINSIASQMGVSLNQSSDVIYAAYTNGYSFVGRGVDALSEICNGNGASWSIQNGDLQIILAGGTTSKQGVVFSANSGLVSSPERIVKASPKPDKETPKRKKRKKEKEEKPQKQAGWKIKTLLASTVVPGDAVKVESREITGWFRVEQINHKGDSHGGEWVSEMDLIERLIYT